MIFCVENFAIETRTPQTMSNPKETEYVESAFKRQDQAIECEERKQEKILEQDKKIRAAESAGRQEIQRLAYSYANVQTRCNDPSSWYGRITGGYQDRCQRAREDFYKNIAGVTNRAMDIRQ